MNIPKNIRENNINKLSNFLSENKANQLEQIIYDFTIEYSTMYRVSDYLQNEIYESKMTHILNNIDQNNLIKNNYLIQAIENNEIDMNKIPYMKPYEIYPEHWKPIIRKIEIAEEKRKNLNVVESFPCKKCGCKKHTIVQMQTRGADEPMTVFITCQMCGNTLKKG
jgi:transcription elongation factor S-II